MKNQRWVTTPNPHCTICIGSAAGLARVRSEFRVVSRNTKGGADGGADGGSGRRGGGGGCCGYSRGSLGGKAGGGGIGGEPGEKG